ncbi:MAG: guanylate kinase [Pirellulales bacterium]
MTTATGRVIVISGPSGSGKTTLVEQLFAHPPGPLAKSVSATTRQPRQGEQEGVHYHFLSAEDFQRQRQSGEFLECFEVFGRGDWYGTPRREVAPRLAAGKWVVLEIDVHGMQAVLGEYPNAETFFVHPGSMAELERRLRDRRTENEAAIQRRLEAARRELASAGLYRHQIVNDDVERAVREIRAILTRPGEVSQ